MRTVSSDIAGYVTGAGLKFDIDDNGEVDALSDGLLIIRHLFGLTGQSLIANAVADNANRKLAPDIRSYLLTLTPP